jgi:hypothetical protein
MSKQKHKALPKSCLLTVKKSPQGATFVDTGSGALEVPELPSAWGHNWVTQAQGDINPGHWPSRLGVGHKASDLTLENTSCYEISNKSDLSEMPKSTRGCSANGRRTVKKCHVISVLMLGLQMHLGCIKNIVIWPKIK